MGAQPPGRWLDAMLSAFERVDFLGPAFGGPEPLLQLLVRACMWLFWWWCAAAVGVGVQARWLLGPCIWRPRGAAPAAVA
eukprot:1143698-Pelagomonas_calceolata.AAC.5